MPMNYNLLQAMPQSKVLGAMPSYTEGGSDTFGMLGKALGAIGGMMGKSDAPSYSNNNPVNQGATYGTSQVGNQIGTSQFGHQQPTKIQNTINAAVPGLTSQKGVNLNLNQDFMGKLPLVMEDLRKQGFQPIIASGSRSLDEQRQKVAQGFSKTMNSRHVHGNAVDIIDSRYGWNDKKYGNEIKGFASAMAQTAQKHGLLSGTQWKSFGPYGDFAHIEYRGNQVDSTNKPGNGGVSAQPQSPYGSPPNSQSNAPWQPYDRNRQKQHPSDTFDMIRGFENFASKPYWDVNAHRAGYGSDTITKADGSIVKVRPGMTVTKEDAERDLARRVPEFQNTIIKQVGADTWQNLDPRVQASLTSVGYNYGSLPKPIIPIVKTGDPEKIANAIRGLKANKYRRNLEADYILKGQKSSMLDQNNTPDQQWGDDPQYQMPTYNPPNQSTMPRIQNTPDSSTPNTLIAGLGGINWGLLNSLYQKRQS